VGEKTCTACDGPLGDRGCCVSVRGSPVQVCSAECGQALAEACLATLSEGWATCAQQIALTVRSIETPSGRISYAEAGSGPVTVFIHGALLNKHLWRHQLTGLSDIRRCIAIDLLAHGDTEIGPHQEVSVTANAQMLREVLDALQIESVDVIGNDSGGAVAQIFAALHPERVRTMTLTNCSAHDNWPPSMFKPFLETPSIGGLGDALNAMLADKSIYRSAAVLGLAYERPEEVADSHIEIYLRPLVRCERRTRDLRRFLTALDSRHTLVIEPRLRQLCAPTLIVWGTDDVYFPVKWAHWLAQAIPGARPVVELTGARIFFPEERPEVFNQLLRDELLAA
jgi:pimeloyl-ACP methyl ester carboxylesterase